MEKPYKNIIETKNRKLGDEWLGWTGDLSGNKNINSGKRLYIGLLLLSLVITGLGLFVFWYLISPRLQQIHSSAPLIAGVLFFLIWSIFGIWFLLIIFSIIFEKHLVLKLGKKEFTLTFTIPIVLELAKNIGISRDRIGHSFVKVVNTLITSSARKVKPEKLMILLPRCLKKEYIDKIKALTKSLNVPVFIVSGGSRARELIYEKRPKAIIGVACERDLLSGMQDVLDKIPVIGIPNARPEGPCKNTVVDLSELEKALKVFLNTQDKATA